MRVLKLAKSLSVCTSSAQSLQDSHTAEPKQQCISQSYEMYLCRSEKSHVDHFTQSWTLDSNQSLSCNNALSDLSDKNDFTQWSKLLKEKQINFFVITSLIGAGIVAGDVETRLERGDED